MHLHRGTTRGQVLIIFVFAIVGLIGITGIAIDGGNIYADRRHAQNAADTAALAGAVVKINEQKEMHDTPGYPVSDCTDLSGASLCGAKVKNAALNMAATNGYDGNIVDSTVQVHIPPIEGPYSEDTYTVNKWDYIQVIIDTNVNTWFARVLGVPQMHNHVSAVARAEYEPASNLYGGNSLVELRPTSGPGCGTEVLPDGDKGGGDVYLGGSSGLILDGGGIFVNSDNPDCALKITKTCPTIELRNGATVEGLGGQFTGCTPPVLTTVEDGYPYPPEEPPVEPIPPAACAGIPVDPTYRGDYNTTDGTYHFLPGHYAKLPPEKNTTLEPGVYCVDELIKTTNSYEFYGDGVFMYVRPGGDFSFNGGTIQLVAPGFLFPGHSSPAPVDAATEPYKGFLIYVDEDDWAGTASDCTVNGGSDTVLRGVIYAPHCNVTIDGGSDTFGITAQVIAYTLKLTGDAVLNFIYNDTEMPATPEKNLTGLYR